MEATVELLVAAGYFRARIHTLPPFDRVVGGLAWALAAAAVDLDLDFRENDNIGRRIRLGEAIERALTKTACPSALQAHQVHGLDYDAIFPVLKWLIKQAYEWRVASGALTRRVSLHTADASMSVPRDVPALERRQAAQRCTRRLDRRYGPRRVLRRKHGAESAQSAHEHARRVLIEFGAAHVTALSSATAPGGEAAEASVGEEGVQTDDVGGEDEQLSRKLVGALVGLGAADIHVAADSYAQQLEALQASGEMAGVLQKRAEGDEAERRLVREKANAHDDGQRAAEATGAREEARTCLAAAEARLAEQRSSLRRLESEIVELESQIAVADASGALAPLRPLLAELEAARARHKGFKAECVQAKAQLEADREAAVSELSDDEIRRVDEAASLHAAAETKARRLRQLVGQKSRAISGLQRVLDEVPTRAELVQYELRFRELYRVVAGKSEETKSHFNTFNRLEERRGILEKEGSLLESIRDSFARASTGGNAAKEKLVASLQNSVQSVEASVAKMRERLADEEEAKRALEGSYEHLLQRQRKYHKLVAELQATHLRIASLTGSS